MLRASMRKISGYWVGIVLAVAAVIVGGTATAQDNAISAAQTFRDCPECPEMVIVPAGSFLMGSSAADADRDMAESELRRRAI